MLCNLCCLPYLLSLTKSVSAKLGVLYCLRQHFSPAKVLTIYKSLARPCMEGGREERAMRARVAAAWGRW